MKTKKRKKSGYFELKGKELEKFKFIMEQVGKDAAKAKRQSMKMMHDAQEAAANMYFNF